MVLAEEMDKTMVSKTNKDELKTFYYHNECDKCHRTTFVPRIVLLPEIYLCGRCCNNSFKMKNYWKLPEHSMSYNDDGVVYEE